MTISFSYTRQLCLCGVSLSFTALSQNPKCDLAIIIRLKSCHLTLTERERERQRDKETLSILKSSKPKKPKTLKPKCLEPNYVFERGRESEAYRI